MILPAAAIFDGDRLHRDAALVIEAGRVVEIRPIDPARAHHPRLEGVLAPGFIDLQVNGGGGVMLNDAPTLDGLKRICAVHAALGATGLTPTLITATPQVTAAALAAGRAAASAGLPGFLGLHLEGPHLDRRRHGAHDPALIRPMEAADCAALCAAAADLPALIVTLAPEAATPDQIAALAAAGVRVSLGHSDAACAAARAAIAAGARLVTHLFNAMSPLRHREPGMVGAALDSPEVACGLIADGFHVAPEVLRIALAAKRGRDGLFLVTDSMAVAGTTLQSFCLAGHEVFRRGGRLLRADGTLAGADLGMAGAIRTLITQAGVPPETALAMATRIPAGVLGLAGAGTLRPGAPADFVHLAPDWSLRGVWRAGLAIGV